MLSASAAVLAPIREAASEGKKTMEVSSVLSTSYSSSSFSTKPYNIFSTFSFISASSSSPNFKCRLPQSIRLPRFSLFRTSAIAVDGITDGVLAEKSTEDSSVSSVQISHLPKIDKSGRFCSPRAARELALSILYAACLHGSDPVRLFEKRVNARRESGYEFDKASLMEYNHMSFGGPPVSVDTVEKAEELMLCDQKVSELEAEVLSAPPKLVYSKLILRFTRKLLVAVADSWDSHVLVIDKVVPQNWRNEPAGRILELSILHLAMADIAVLGTRHQIVINEAVDLAKRFCDGAAPRIINGCLGTFVKDFEVKGVPRSVAKQTI